MRTARWMRLGALAPEELRARCSALAAAQPPRCAPIALWMRQGGCNAFVLIAPALLAPGRRVRWVAWALSPAVAACRQLGLRAYFDEAEIRLHGSPIAACSAEAVGDCVLAACTFQRSLPGVTGAQLEAALRTRIEAQHDWQFETAWPSPGEAATMAGARVELQQ